MPRDPTSGLQLLATEHDLVPHALHGGRLWASRGYTLLCRDVLPGSDGPWRSPGKVPEPLWRRGLARSGLAANALRLGVHGLLPLASGSLLACVTGRLLRSDDGHNWAPSLDFPGFRKPTRHGLLASRDGRIYCAEYSLNPDRSRAIHLWRSDDDGRSFAVVHTFAAGRVRHIHFIQEDPFGGQLWLGTGDADRESALWQSGDRGATWDEVGAGSQKWRAIALAFREDAVVWGTDAGSDAGSWPNRILSWERKTGRLDELGRLQGPVHGITATADGDVLLATGIEGGQNETDRCVHVWHGKNGADFREVARWRRGLQPRRVQYAVAHFVRGQESFSKLYMGLRGLWQAQSALAEVALGPAAP